MTEAPDAPCSLHESIPEDGLCACPSECAGILKVLADPCRLRLVRALLAGPMTVQDLELATGLRQARVSHHLGRMRPTGLVLAERQGRNVLYRVNPRLSTPTGLDLGCAVISFRGLGPIDPA